MFTVIDNPVHEPTVRSWGTEGAQAVEFGAFIIVCTSPQDCDAGIRAFIEAKDKLIQATGAQVRVTDSDCACGHPGSAHIYAGSEPCTQCDCGQFAAPVPGKNGTPAIAENDLDTLLAAGYNLIPVEDEADGGHIIDLRRPDGTLAETGNGPTYTLALEHLRDRLARHAEDQS